MKLVMPRSTTGRPSVTIVVPCYNYGRYLPDLVRAILAEDGVEARVIIVDDASPDGSAEIAASLAAADERVTAILHPTNLGHIRTYNDGLRAVRTEYVGLVSADDVIAPGSLHRATALLDRFPRVGMVYGVAIPTYDESEIGLFENRLPESWTIWSGRRWMRARARRGKNPILSPEVLVRTRALEQIGLYNPQLPHTADLEYWLRIAARWDVARINCRPQAYYRVHGANMHITDFSDLAVDLSQRLAAFSFLTSPDAADFAGRERILRRAQRAIRRRALVAAERELDRGSSPQDVAGLVALAASASTDRRASGLSRSVGRRLARAGEGRPPLGAQRVIEFGRTQFDRVRFRSLRLVARI